MLIPYKMNHIFHSLPTELRSRECQITKHYHHAQCTYIYTYLYTSCTSTWFARKVEGYELSTESETKRASENRDTTYSEYCIRSHLDLVYFFRRFCFRFAIFRETEFEQIVRKSKECGKWIERETVWAICVWMWEMWDTKPEWKLRWISKCFGQWTLIVIWTFCDRICEIYI